jgi:predicted metal-dependent phosphotriesterase family hydrolase
MAHIQTVNGPVHPAQIDGVLHHEHLLSLTPGPWLSGGRTPGAGAPPAAVQRDQDQVQRAVDALSQLPALGINTVVDLSPYGVVGRDARGANVALLREISRRSGLHIITGTSVYLEAFSPTWTVDATVDELTERFIADATTGIDGGGIRAGIYGEQATSLGRITPHEEKCLRSAARAHVQTGLSLVTHTTHGTMALEQIAILEQEGADLRRVVIGHMDTHRDIDYVRRVADRGVNIAFDTIGKQYWDFRVQPLPADQPDGEFPKQAYLRSDHTRADRIAQLVADGYIGQILLAQDLTGEEVYLNPATHGQWGYAYLVGAFSQLLGERGVSAADIRTMICANPALLLTVDR